MKKIRIGILNVQHADNYGAVLMTYALQYALNRDLYDKVSVVSINYSPENKNGVKQITETLKSRFKRFVKKMLLPFGNYLSPYEKCMDRFESFRKKYVLTKKCNNQNIGSATRNIDIFIVGSDVVWKPSRLFSSEAYIYLLQFVKNKRKKGRK